MAGKRKTGNGCARSCKAEMEGDMKAPSKMYFEDDDNVIHECDGAQMIPNNRDTFLVWTLCGRDVPAGKAFKVKDGEEDVTCPNCELRQ